MRIAVIHKSETVSRAEVAQWVAACQIQLTRDFAPVWGYGAEVYLLPQGERAPDSDWQMFIADHAEGEGYLGYHDRDSTGWPRGFVYVETTKANGGKPSVTFSHEVLEMVLDPWLWAAAVTPNPKMQAVSVEACDAVEADEYEINSIAVSNFVLPAWFDEQGQAPFDFLRKLKAPFTLTPGGYVIAWTARKGWHDQAHGQRRAKVGMGRTGRIKAMYASLAAD